MCLGRAVLMVFLACRKADSPISVSEWIRDEVESASVLTIGECCRVAGFTFVQNLVNWAVEILCVYRCLSLALSSAAPVFSMGVGSWSCTLF